MGRRAGPLALLDIGGGSLEVAHGQGSVRAGTRAGHANGNDRVPGGQEVVVRGPCRGGSYAGSVQVSSSTPTVWSPLVSPVGWKPSVV